MLDTQFFACHRPCQPPRFCSRTRSAASAKVGTPSARRFSESGSPPERANLRLARASSRASARVTSPAAPSPSSRRRLRRTSRWTQLRVPVGRTNKYRPFPCPWRPSVAERTKAAESALSGWRPPSSAGGVGPACPAPRTRAIRAPGSRTAPSRPSRLSIRPCILAAHRRSLPGGGPAARVAGRVSAAGRRDRGRGCPLHMDAVGHDAGRVAGLRRARSATFGGSGTTMSMAGSNNSNAKAVARSSVWGRSQG